MYCAVTVIGIMWFLLGQFAAGETPEASFEQPPNLPKAEAFSSLLKLPEEANIIPMESLMTDTPPAFSGYSSSHTCYSSSGPSPPTSSTSANGLKSDACARLRDLLPLRLPLLQPNDLLNRTQINSNSKLCGKRQLCTRLLVQR